MAQFKASFVISRFSEVQKHLLSVTEKKAGKEINKSRTCRHVRCTGNMNPCLKNTEVEH